MCICMPKCIILGLTVWKLQPDRGRIHPQYTIAYRAVENIFWRFLFKSQGCQSNQDCRSRLVACWLHLLASQVKPLLNKPCWWIFLRQLTTTFQSKHNWQNYEDDRLITSLIRTDIINLNCYAIFITSNEQYGNGYSLTHRWSTLDCR